jgi:general secretion pathway protein G
MQARKDERNGFSLSELAVVILIFAILAGVLVPRVTDRMALSRDAHRLADLRTLRDAVERYFLDKGAYPPATLAKAGDGYDVSTDGDFIPELARTGYLSRPLLDPINDANNYYGYNVFPEGTNGCKGKGKFYVLGIKRFETADYAAAHPGYFKCAHKNWGEDFEYVTGGGAAEQ